MQVRVGVQFVLAEIVVETELSEEEVEDKLAEALHTPNGLLVLEDGKGSRYFIPGKSIAYLKISASDDPLPPGFGNTL